MTNIDKIKGLWEQINHKGRFMELVAKDLNKSKKTLKVYWFSNYADWSIPKEHQKRVIELMLMKIDEQ